MIIKIGNKKLRIKSSFSQFTLADIKAWWAAVEVIESLEEERKLIAAKYEQIEKTIDQRTAEQTENEIRYVETLADVLKSKLSLAYIQIISSVAKKGTQEYLENTNGITHEHILSIASALVNQVGDFFKYFESVECVEKFKHVGEGWYPKSYKVHGMDSQTLIRDALASVQISTALDFKNEIGIGRWDNICKFVALVARPKGQSFEMAFTHKSFINSKVTKGMDPGEKLSFYQQVLDKSVEGREKHFKNLPLPIAIGVIKEYEKKKQR